jgi:hypothetical protein
MRNPEMGKPASGKTGSLEITNSLAAFENRDSTANIVAFQAAYLSSRFHLPSATAATIAEIAFQTWRAA